MCEISGMWHSAILYSSILKVAAGYSFDILGNSYENKGIISQKMIFMKHINN
jgi:hypothetical protein